MSGHAGSARATGQPWQRPQAVLLNFCAVHLLGGSEALYSGSFIEVLSRVGVGEHAARSTLSRMVRRGLLDRYRSGKRAYFGLTDRSARILREGGRRVRETVNRNWDGQWTVLAFSLPETRRADRHLLRSRLTWAGFGPLHNGLWISPQEVDLTQLLAGLDVADHVKAFRAGTVHPTDVHRMITDTWDLPGLAARYRDFLHRWDIADPLVSQQDALPNQLLMHTEWSLLIRHDPGLPVAHLPADWPAVRAEHVFLRMRSLLAPRAAQEVATIADRLPLTPAGAGTSGRRPAKRPA